jgi:hypothetical protein
MMFFSVGYNSIHRTACFKATAKPYNFSSPKAELSSRKTAFSSQSTKARDAVLLPRGEGEGGGVKTFSDLEACTFVTATVDPRSGRVLL